jgi:glycosyltransferase involved in cell wall biosynthesis
MTAKYHDATWHILDVGSIWMQEFAAALSLQVSTISWAPRMLKLGMLRDWQRPELLSNPSLTIQRFPLQRGYARGPMTWLVPFERKVLERLKARSKTPALSPLICSTPYYAPVAERWPGPVVYYATDLTVAYPSLNAAQVNRLDRRMCRAATAVCPNSKRIADYFVERAGCDPGKITIVPNATRESNVAPGPLVEAGLLPEDVKHLKRPIAGVIGNLAGNMDWLLLEQSIRLTPGVTWVFVGPTTMGIADRAQEAARARVLLSTERAVFVGMKSYDQLQAYARCFDVAVLPYKKHEPTFSGSSTRFYEHLAACRPIIATRGFAELLEKPPLLTLVDTAAEVGEQMAALGKTNYSDGYERARWDASRIGTWEERARAIVRAVEA